MRSMTYFLAALTLSMAIGSSAQAQQGRRGSGHRPTFEQLDQNGDGKIVASEVPARGWQWLSRADTNKDNAVTKAELEAARAANQGAGQRGAKKARPTFEQLDNNGDGKIVASEVPAYGWQRLSRADTNKDNAVTKAELEAARTNHRGLGRRGAKVRPTFEQLDNNGDGKLVQTEVPERMWQRLQRADANKDKVITKAEFDAMPRRRPAP